MCRMKLANVCDTSVFMVANERAKEKASVSVKETNAYAKVLLSRCRTNWFNTMGASNESRLHRTQASIHSSNRMQLRCRIRFDWIHSGCVAGRIRFRFRLASFVSYAFKSDWRQPARDTRQTVKFHIGSLSVIVETRFESDGFS